MFLGIATERQDYVSRCAFVMLLLVLNNLCSMESEGIVIRIKTPVGDMDSSVDFPSHLNFNDLLVSCCFNFSHSMFYMASQYILEREPIHGMSFPDESLSE